MRRKREAKNAANLADVKKKHSSAALERDNSQGAVFDRLVESSIEDDRKDRAEAIKQHYKPVLPPGYGRPKAGNLVTAAETVYSEKDIDEMRQQFDVIDVEGNGILRKDEIEAFCGLYGINVAFVKLAFKLFDKDKDGSMSFDEFMEFVMTARQFRKTPRLMYRMLFEVLDVEKNGHLGPDEMVEFCDVLHIPMTRKDAIDLIQKVDFRSVGVIIYDDLEHWIESY